MTKRVAGTTNPEPVTICFSSRLRSRVKDVSMVGATGSGWAQELPMGQHWEQEPAVGQQKAPSAWGQLNEKAGELGG